MLLHTTIQPAAIVVVQLFNPFNAFPGSNHRWNISFCVENLAGCLNLRKILGGLRIQGLLGSVSSWYNYRRIVAL